MASARPSLDLQNMDEVRQVFERFDANKDGKISAEELRGVLKALRSDISTEAVAEMMVEIDTDKDGGINLQEFTAICSGESDKDLKKAFELYDKDNDGKISAAELHLILTSLGEHRSRQDCAGMIKSVDSDGDGYVSFEEFKKMMASNKDAK